jgi:hypothetical protein
MLAHTNEDFPDLRDITARSKTADRSEFNNLPKLFQAVILTCATLAGKTEVDARTVYKTTWDSLETRGK